MSLEASIVIFSWKKCQNWNYSANVSISGEGGAEIFVQGSCPWFFLILSEGICDISYNGEIINTRQSGECLDEISLVYDCNRLYTVKARTNCKMWGLGRKISKKY